MATGQTLSRTFCLALLTEATRYAGEVTEGLRLVTETLEVCEASGRGDLLAEAYRLKGELLLQQTAQGQPRQNHASSTLWPLPDTSRPNPGSSGRR